MDQVKVIAHGMDTSLTIKAGTVQNLKIYFTEPGFEFWIPSLIPPYSFAMVELFNLRNNTCFDIHLKKKIVKRLESVGNCKNYGSAEFIGCWKTRMLDRINSNLNCFPHLTWDFGLDKNDLKIENCKSVPDRKQAEWRMFELFDDEYKSNDLCKLPCELVNLILKKL